MSNYANPLPNRVIFVGKDSKPERLRDELVGLLYDLPVIEDPYKDPIFKTKATNPVSRAMAETAFHGSYSKIHKTKKDGMADGVLQQEDKVDTTNFLKCCSRCRGN